MTDKTYDIWPTRQDWLKTRIGDVIINRIERSTEFGTSIWGLKHLGRSAESTTSIWDLKYKRNRQFCRKFRNIKIIPLFNKLLINYPRTGVGLEFQLFRYWLILETNKIPSICMSRFQTKKDKLSDYLLGNFTFRTFLITFRTYYYDFAIIVRIFLTYAADRHINGS